MRNSVKHIICLVIAFVAAVSLQAQNLESYRNSDIECLASELDGSLTIRVTGGGKNKKDAEEQARKNAVHAIIFNGVHDKKTGTTTRPLVTEVNARERHEDYFNKFFTDGGEYKKYVSENDAKRLSKEKSGNKYERKYRLTIRVLRSELKARLKSDGIIKN